MYSEMEAIFASRGSTPKGRRTLAAVYRAGMAAIADYGAERASLEVIAARAGLTQAALRHYFPTRDQLLAALLETGSVWFRAQLAAIAARRDIPAARRLEQCIEWHLRFMEGVDTLYWLEASAYWIRTATGRRVRNAFYRWLVAEYATMIGEIHRALRKPERLRRSYALASLVLGSWITHGRGSAWSRDLNVEQRRSLLLRAAMALATPAQGDD